MKKILIAVIAVFSLFSCTQKNWEDINDGIVVTVTNPTNEQATKKVRLQVVNDKVIHVTATPESTFPKDSSLIAVNKAPESKIWSVSSTDSEVILKTASVTATVTLADGHIVFTDKDGKVLLAEKPQGRSFKAINIEGTDGYEMQQIWTSDKDEAIYGLGQHQSDEFNYKNKSEELFQYNTKVSIPFFMSTKNYGILWDNYSLSRYGNPNDFSQLNEAFTIYDKTGKEGGLTSTWKAKNGKTIKRIDPFLYFENGKANKEYMPKDFPLDGSNVVFEGELQPKETGDYNFILYYAGYTKVYLNDKLVVAERWRTAWNPNSYKFNAHMEAGKKAKLRIEWIPDGAVSYCGLRVHTPKSGIANNQLSMFSEMGKELNYYFIAGDNMDDVISGYRTVTGKSQIMPRWAMGYWQSRERYKTSDEMLSALKELRRRKFPIDNIVLDWNYWPETKWGSHKFDEPRFPNPKAMVDSIHAMNAHMMISVWPKFYITTEHYKQFDSKGWMYQQAVKDSIKDWVGPGYIGSFYDAYSADARKLFWKQMRDCLYPLGIDAWWMDASEPNIRDCTDMDYRKKLCGPTALGPSTEYFNAYALMNAEAIYDGQRSVDNNKRVFLLTRSGFAGNQRYSTATWSGDIGTRWEDMKAQISAGINFSMSGIPYWTMDVGGFCVEKRYEAAQNLFDKVGIETKDLKEWRELNTRWFQFGAFCPLYRAHGQFPLREIYNIAPDNHPAYKSIMKYTQLRYKLMPYIYSLAGMTYFDDYTIMRGLVMDFENDKGTYNVGDQFMFGPAFMACPIYEYEARSRKVYFPATEGGWYDYYTNANIKGGQTQNVDAPYETMPLYIKAGSIVPMGPVMQYADEIKPEKLTIKVYEGANGEFTLYEDENTNYNYEKGHYAMIPFSYDEGSKTLVIGARKGSFDGMLENRVFNIVKISKEGAESPKEAKYNGEKISITL